MWSRLLNVTASINGGAGCSDFRHRDAFPLDEIPEYSSRLSLPRLLFLWENQFSTSVSGVPSFPLQKLPIFMSSGAGDPAVTREVTDRLHDALLKDGFKNVRYEHFDGGHQLYQPNLQAALEWFLAQKTKPAHAELRPVSQSLKGTGGPSPGGEAER
jgi:hypothetical protein